MAEKPSYKAYKNLQRRVQELEQELLQLREAQRKQDVESAYLDQLLESAQEAIVIADNYGKIIRVNQEFTRVFGYGEEESVGFLIDDLIVADDSREEARSITERVAKGEKASFEAIRRCKDGRLIHVSCLASPVVIDGDQSAVCGIYRDISEGKRVEKLLRQSEENYRALFESTGAAMLVIEEDMTISMVNSEAERLIGFSKEEVEGKRKWTEFIPGEELEKMKNYHVGRRTNGDEVPSEYESRMLDKEGKVKNIFIKVGLIPGTGRSVASLTDISSLKRMEQALRESEEKYRSILDSIEDGYFELNLKGAFLFFNDSVCKILGAPREELEGRNIREFAAEETRERGYRAFNKVYTSGEPAKGFGWEMLGRDNIRRFVEASVSLIRDKDGHRIGFRGILRDVTERRKIEEELQNERDFLNNVLESTADAVGLVDKQGKFLRWNKRAEEICGYTLEGLKEKRAFELYADKDKYDEMVDLLRKQGFVRDYEVALKRKDGGKVPVAASISLLKDENNRNRGSITLARDLTERKKMEEDLRFLSFHDSLTGLYNRTYFEQEMRRLRGGRCSPIGIIVCDVDGLKIINDMLGHERGDSVIIAAGRAIKGCFREGDVVARIGGDEFSVVLPRTDEKTVRKAARRIENAVAKYNSRNPTVCLSLSIGFSVGRHEDLSINELLKDADNNMYQEKLRNAEGARKAIVQSLVKALEVRDYIMEGHAERLQDMVLKTAEPLDLDEEYMSRLSLLARFHDIGKVGIPDRIIFKPEILNNDEMAEVKRHPEIGYRIAKNDPDLAGIADWILKHHEWWNGQGYPQGLKGEEIPLSCRILAIADAYDTMRKGRHYQNPVSHDEAVAELRRCAGTQFDPQLVERFVRVMEE